MAYIDLNQVSKHFGSVVAVDKLNLQSGKGECVGMLGPSGCGKTTTLRMVAGFEDLDDGEIRSGSDGRLQTPQFFDRGRPIRIRK